MLQLNLPNYNFKLKKEKEKDFIFDVFRKKYIKLTSEEWVRQNVLMYLINEKKYPQNLIAVEKSLTIGGKKLRFDALVYDKTGSPMVLIEFKAPQVDLTQEVFDQAAVYNFRLKVPYLLLSNGLVHHFCKVDIEQNRYIFSELIPDFPIINNI